jgi:S1-C subfamily serine protease
MIDLDELNAGVARLAEQTRRSLVRVEAGRRGMGSGTILHGEGLVVTNAHVVAGGASAVWDGDGRRWPAKLLACDRPRDLAALAIEAHGWPALELGDSGRVKAGELAIALGHPWGVEGAATAGMVVGLERAWPGGARGPHDWLVVALRLRPGHSGGPLVNAYGHLIGINTVMAGPGIGAAIPAHVIKTFLRQAFGQGLGDMPRRAA